MSPIFDRSFLKTVSSLNCTCFRDVVCRLIGAPMSRNAAHTSPSIVDRTPTVLRILTASMPIANSICCETDLQVQVNYQINDFIKEKVSSVCDCKEVSLLWSVYAILRCCSGLVSTALRFRRFCPQLVEIRVLGQGHTADPPAKSYPFSRTCMRSNLMRVFAGQFAYVGTIVPFLSYIHVVTNEILSTIFNFFWQARSSPYCNRRFNMLMINHLHLSRNLWVDT
jgi:hypothetical protein